jgi:hypothetical protein
MAPRAIRNTTGKPVTPESLDKRLHMRHIRSLEPTGDLRQLDRDYPEKQAAQAEREQDPFPSEE